MHEDPNRPAEVLITEEKWDIFSKTVRRKKDLFDWEKWFLSRGKTAKRVRSQANDGYVLKVYQRWHITRNQSKNKKIKKH